MRFVVFEELIARFQTNAANAILYYLILAVAILVSLILHECGHGLVAYWCGDPTAKMMGRLTLNPAKHLDPLGTLCMLFLRFGWAKPVPINPRNFKHYRRDYVFVSLAGITVNLLLFLLFAGLSVLLNRFLWNEMVDSEIVSYMYFMPYNAVASGNFDVSRYFLSTDALDIQTLMRAPALMYLQFFFQVMSIMNLSLAIFNLLPIPPLDGFRVLDATVLRGRFQPSPQIYQIIRIVMIVVLFSGIGSWLINLIFEPVYNGVLRLFLSL